MGFTSPYRFCLACTEVSAWLFTLQPSLSGSRYTFLFDISEIRHTSWLQLLNPSFNTVLLQGLSLLSKRICHSQEVRAVTLDETILMLLLQHNTEESPSAEFQRFCQVTDTPHELNSLKVFPSLLAAL